MPDLVPEVPEQRAVGLLHLHPQLLAMHIVTLGQIQCDDAVIVAGDHLLECAGEQPKAQPVLGIPVAPHDGQLQLVQLDDQPSLGCLGPGECRQALGV